jgi:uncharacterized protein (DUF58 family)
MIRWARRLLRHLTREGRHWIAVSLGLGLAALFSGNNLAFLLFGLLLGFILVSGMLSDLSLAGLRLGLLPAPELYAGQPALFGAVLANRKRRLPSYSITVEPPDPPDHRGTGGRRLHVPRLAAGDERALAWPLTLPARGRHRLPPLRLSTRFPFGLFVKTRVGAPETEVLVYPALVPVSPERLRRSGGLGATPVRRRGRGAELYNLRPYRAGDDPRLIHWRSSARAQALTVRELEEDATRDVRLVLQGDGRSDPAALERGLSEAASLAVHLVRAGTGVELSGPGLLVPLGRGHGQERKILTALALYAPGGGTPAGTAGLPEVHVALG